MREIVFDTETTGLDPQGGDRLVELGCVEMVNRVATGATYHAYFDPERDMPAEAEAVHGLSAAFLSDKPKFAAGAAEFLAFIGDAPMVAHNAGFDFGFINAELTHRVARGQPRPHGRYGGHRAAQASGRQAQPRCAVQPLWHRPQPPPSMAPA
jgi:DNA polymerase III epsilon subunit